MLSTKKKIGFTDIERVVCAMLESFDGASRICDLDGILNTAKESRIIAREMIEKLSLGI